MSIARHHSEWLSLLEVSGPFVSMPVLLKVFPQGLDAYDSEASARIRLAREEWLEKQNDPAKYRAWVQFILSEILEYKDILLKEVQAGTPGCEIAMAENGEKLRADYCLTSPAGHPNEGKPHLLIQLYPAEQDLEKPLASKRWKASPATRMMELLRGSGVSFGLITNGEHWMLVYAPQGEVTTFVSWYLTLWLEEPVTLRAFRSLLSVRRQFGVAEDETFEAMLKDSSKDQHEVTDQLGYQVRKAVEVLIQSFDRLDQDHAGKLLLGVDEKELYDAALTVMMRLVFLFSAEERELLLLGDPLYDQNYAVSTLRDQLRETADQHGEEILERRSDAWSRLLATFRAVYGGVENDSFRLQAYGGSLFDPDRYPFLEGRKTGTHWHKSQAEPLKINNRTVLHLLEAMQVLQVKVPGGGPAEARKLSFRALDIEQIGHIYEGLLDHSTKRSKDVVLGLKGSKDLEPEIELSKLEELQAKGGSALIEYLGEETGRSKQSLEKALKNEAESKDQKLSLVCGSDKVLIKRVKRFECLLREDTFGLPVVIRPGSVYVTSSTERRSSGTHYTPRSLTEPIVQHTLEPLVYIGPAEGKSREDWKLKGANVILELKVCDMAMGSGAFLVQVIRYLSERLVMAWEETKEKMPAKHHYIEKDGALVAEDTGLSLPQDDDEKLFLARRLVADRCIYGVDINPMAVEMAKLSLWLITLQKNRPFNFLDHALKCGDSLLGVTSVEQIEYFSLREGSKQKTFATLNLERLIKETSSKRQSLENLSSNDYGQIDAKKHLYEETETTTARVKALADCLIAFELQGFDGKQYEDSRVRAVASAESAMRKSLPEFQVFAHEHLNGTNPFHWLVEFPEVLARGGFNAFVGNPPFLGGKRISSTFGKNYSLLLPRVFSGTSRNADICAFFFRRAFSLIRKGGLATLLATNTISEGETRDAGLKMIVEGKGLLVRAARSFRWPGTANVHAVFVQYTNGSWNGAFVLDDKEVEGITHYLEAGLPIKDPLLLTRLPAQSYIGSVPYGDGFVLTPNIARRMIETSAENKAVVKPYLTGDDVNSLQPGTIPRWIIDFGVMSEIEATKFILPFRYVYENVRSFRLTQDPTQYQQMIDFWWQHWRPRQELYQEVASKERIIVMALTSKFITANFLPTGIVYDQTLICIPTESFFIFAVLQSWIHAVWAIQFGATIGETFRYNPTRCYQTFPFPNPCNVLAEFGFRYWTDRDRAMSARREGITEFYNRFHKSDEKSDDIERLRALQIAMDQAVTTAYGWNDLDLQHDFHETRQGIRYTISESARRIVLDGLLVLNNQRHEEEQKIGFNQKTANADKAKKKERLIAEPDLFGQATG